MCTLVESVFIPHTANKILAHGWHAVQVNQMPLEPQGTESPETQGLSTHHTLKARGPEWGDGQSGSPGRGMVSRLLFRCCY